ncbi:MAG: hypothetical protein ABIJ43_04430 [Candidatus Beckwithbacteria bacterium]|nr:hypothetical protein [Patescibacteria group bacterium]
MVEEKTVNSIETPETLGGYLSGKGVSVSEWGKNEAKTVRHFFNEIKNGDCVLVDTSEGLRRRVVSANVRVYHQADDDLFYLKEDRQEFKDGRVRKRDWFTWSASEKVKPTESIEEGGERVLREELKIQGDLNIVRKEVKPESTESPSYPGLHTEYQSNFFDAYLTDKQYNPDGYIEEQPDKITYWVWEKVE